MQQASTAMNEPETQPDDLFPATPADAQTPVDSDPVEAPPPTDEQPTDVAAKQFSVWELAVLVAMASAGLATLQFLSLPVAATVYGAIALAGVVIMQLLQIQRAILVVGWWLLLAVYLVACIAAALGNA